MISEEAIRILKELYSCTNTTLMEELNSLGRERVLLDDCTALTMAIEAVEKCKKMDEALGQGGKVYIIPKDGLWLHNGVDVMNAIEKQIPVRPIKNSYCDEWYCPECENVVSFDRRLVGEDGIYFSKVCDNCGQVLLWEDNEDDESGSNRTLS